MGGILNENQKNMNRNMNQIFCWGTSAWFFLMTDCRSDTYEFPKGEVPSVSMEHAIRICKSMVKLTPIGEFNPSEAILVGNKDSNGGAWNLVQHGKNGEVYRFVIYFPEDKCVVIDESKGNKPIALAKRDGTRMEVPKEEMPAEKDAQDPFSEKKEDP